MLKGNWRVIVFVDDKASPAQEAALVGVFSGKGGGPIADLAKLVGEVVAVRRAPITFDVVKGKGTLKVGDTVEAELEPYRGPTGQPTTLMETIFSTVPGSPAYVGKASTYRQRSPRAERRLRPSGPQRHPVGLPVRAQGCRVIGWPSAFASRRY